MSRFWVFAGQVAVRARSAWRAQVRCGVCVPRANAQTEQAMFQYLVSKPMWSTCCEACPVVGAGAQGGTDVMPFGSGGFPRIGDF